MRRAVLMIRQAISPRFAIRIRLNIFCLLAAFGRGPAFAGLGRNLAREDGCNNSVVQQNQTEATADMPEIRFYREMRRSIGREGAVVLAGVVEQSLRRAANMVSTRLPQFPFAAITVEDADGGHSVVSCTNHVMASVADHDGLRRVDARRLQGETQELGLVGILAVQFGTEHAFKID